MSASTRPSLRRWSAVLAAALCVVLVPVLLALLAPPPVVSDGPVFDAVTRDGCTAALDRVERVLAGALDVRLLAPALSGRIDEASTLPAWVASPAPGRAAVAQPCEAERRL